MPPSILRVDHHPNCPKPLTLTGIGRIAIFSWRVTSGCVTLLTKSHARRQNMGYNAPIWYASVCILVFNYVSFTCYFNRLLLQPGTAHKIHLSSGAFWIFFFFNKTKLSERMWAKLVNLDTLHWYCDGLEPTAAAQCYDCQVRQRKCSPILCFLLFLHYLTPDIRPLLCKNGRQQKKGLHQATSYEEETIEESNPKGTGPVSPSTKRKPSKKTDHLPKKPKVVPEPVMGSKVETKKTVTSIRPGKGKGHITGPVSFEKPPFLLCEDSKYALERLSSIIIADNYEDLSNHATGAMGEMGLFSIAQVTVSILLLFFFLFPGF